MTSLEDDSSSPPKSSKQPATPLLWSSLSMSLQHQSSSTTPTPVPQSKASLPTSSSSKADSLGSIRSSPPPAYTFQSGSPAADRPTSPDGYCTQTKTWRFEFAVEGVSNDACRSAGIVGYLNALISIIVGTIMGIGGLIVVSCTQFARGIEANICYATGRVSPSSSRRQYSPQCSPSCPRASLSSVYLHRRGGLHPCSPRLARSPATRNPVRRPLVPRSTRPRPQNAASRSRSPSQYLKRCPLAALEPSPSTRLLFPSSHPRRRRAAGRAWVGRIAWHRPLPQPAQGAS